MSGNFLLPTSMSYRFSASFARFFLVLLSHSLSLTLCFSFSFSSPSTKSWDTLIKISSDRQNMIFAFYPTDRQRCGFWGREINISSRLWQLCMHSRRPHKLESNSSAHEGMVEYAEKGAIASPVSLSLSLLSSSLLARLCLFSSIKLRLLETVNYVIIAWRKTGVASRFMVFRKFIDFFPRRFIDGATVEFNRRHRPSSSRGSA